MKNINKTLMLTLSLLIVITLLTQQVIALGVSPGRASINFEPGLEKEVTFSVINSDRKDMSVVFYVRGDLAKYVTLSQESASFDSSEETKSFSYKIRLPQTITKPGEHRAEIVILEVPKEEKTIKTDEGREVLVLETSSISARLAVVTQLIVNVLHPGKYVDGELEVIHNPEKEGEIRFLVPVTSKSKLGIGSVKATIDIYTSLNEKIATIETNDIPLKSKERRELSAIWNSKGFNQGKYRAVATIIYDGETTYADKNFDIGSRKLVIENIIVDDFSLGEIAKFQILVNNNWNEAIKNVNIEITVFNEEDEIMAEFKSANYEVSALSKTELVSYWDTVGVSEGTYSGKLSLIYGEEIEERPIQVRITEDSLEVIGFTGKAVFPKESNFSIQNILIIIVILLVIVNGIWFFLFLRKKKK